MVHPACSSISAPTWRSAWPSSRWPTTSNGLVGTIVNDADRDSADTENDHQVQVTAGEVALDIKHVTHDPSCGAQMCPPLTTVSADEATLG